MDKLKKIPEFKTEAEERGFWEKHDSSEYVDWKRVQPVSMPNPKPSTKTALHRPPKNS